MTHGQAAATHAATANNNTGAVQLTGREIRHIAIYISSMSGGGAELSMLRLAEDFVGRGYRVDLVLNRKMGPYLQRVPPEIRIFGLSRCGKVRARWLAVKAYPQGILAMARPVILAKKPLMDLRYIGPLTDYLVAEQPDAVVSALSEANIVAILARRLAKTRTVVVVSERDTLSKRVADEVARKPGPRWRWKHQPRLIGKVYPLADKIVAISDGVGDDLSAAAGIKRSAIDRIYNPVACEDVESLAAQPVDHAWLDADQPPVILAVGRLIPKKDFTTLIKGFALLRQTRTVRLLIIGEGDQQAELLQLADTLGVSNDMQLLGWVDNPYRYMARASLFAVSSAYEGLCRVLIEAMACGCPVVSTDCPHGPREVLDHGRYGPLVPVGDVQAMADAMRRILDDPPRPETMKNRAGYFSVRASADGYLDAIMSARSGLFGSVQNSVSFLYHSAKRND